MSLLEQTTAVEIMEIRVSLSEAGKGERVLFLHGNPGSRKDFAEFLNLEQPFACHYIIPDRPGHMGSEPALREEEDHWADVDLYAKLIDEKCDGRAIVVGYSMGCFIAAKLAIKYPKKIKGLVFLAPHLVLANESEKLSFIPSLATGAITGLLMGVLVPVIYEKKIITYLNNLFSPLPVSNEYMETWLSRYTRFESLLAMIDDKNTMLKTVSEVYKRLSEIKCPIQVVVGDQDKISSIEQEISLLQDKCPQTLVNHLADAGHALNLTHTTDCLMALSTLYARIV